jgi:phosphate transport system substrate-binding protein
VIARVLKLAGLVVGGAFAFATPSSAQDLNGAGATFPFPIYDKWFKEYAAQKGVKINYQPIGSGGGVRQFTEGTVDFGASDAPMSDEELSKLKGPAVHIPTVLGADVITWNLPEVTQPLKFTGQLIADIYMGKVTKWNSAEIAALNKGVKLPDRDIVVVHRSDGSGTTYIFTDYLTTVSPAWASGPGRGKDVQWPVGLGGKGNDGVSGQVKQTPGAIGYVELAYARQNKLPFGEVKNAAGVFVTPTIESIVAAAAASASKVASSPDLRVSFVNAPGKTSYPISSWTYILLYTTQADPVKGKKVVDFLRWAIHDGQKDAVALDYGPLPAPVVATLDKRLGTIKNVAK